MNSEYGIEKWRISLKEILWNTGIKNEQHILILPGDLVEDDEILDDINTLLNTADLADIFTTEERSHILSRMMDTVHEVVYLKHKSNVKS